MNAESIKSKAYRILRPLSRYKPLNDYQLPYDLSDLPRGEDELLGVYENVVGQRDSSIVFSTQGIYVDLTHHWTYVPYAHISTITLPEGDKHAVERIALQIAGGISLQIIVTGGEEQFRDVYEVLRFLQRVTYQR